MNWNHKKLNQNNCNAIIFDPITENIGSVIIELLFIQLQKVTSAEKKLNSILRENGVKAVKTKTQLLRKRKHRLRLF